MRVMLDTNVLLSLLLFPNERMNSMVENIWEKYQLVLSSFVVDELKAVIAKKFPKQIPVIDKLLEQIAYELVYTPQEIQTELFEIRDMKDYPVLYTAIVANIDILITGDKDFADIDIDKPEILTPSEYISKYI